MDIEAKVSVTHAEPVAIEIARGQKGTYAWTIKIRAATPQAAIEQIVATDNQLKGQYQGQIISD